MADGTQCPYCRGTGSLYHRGEGSRHFIIEYDIEKEDVDLLEGGQMECEHCGEDFEKEIREEVINPCMKKLGKSS